MPDRLPSLTALRAFEAAARHRSFSKAANELSVTPAAVGFQIKQLEDDLGGPLFVRKHRAVELTPMGSNLACKLAPAFDAITEAWRSVDRTAPGSTLRVTAPENAVLNWLLPATTAAQSVRPGPAISWDASRQVRDLSGNALDVAVRYGLEPDERFFCEPVLRPWFTPLMRPEVGRLVRGGKDLLRQGLIDVETGIDGPGSLNAWPPFLRLMGLPPVTDFAVSCPETGSALELASTTNFVAIGGYFVAAKYLRAGSLVAPIPKAVVPRSRFWLMCPKGRERDEGIIWLREALAVSVERLMEGVKGVEVFELDGRPVGKMV